MLDKNGIPFHYCPSCGRSTIGEEGLCLDCDPAESWPLEGDGYDDDFDFDYVADVR